ncbi:MAG: aminoacyl-tRNA hydrolase [bacterium]|nr:aminoacyl-tRNA hydrolase [bacterium]
MNKISNGIKLIVGLGNPGKEYERTRHNAGFLFIDELERYLEIKNSRLCPHYAKSQSFMNESGKEVAVLIKLYKIKPENILVVHDDIDISWGNFKFSFGRSSAGHKGIESVIKSLKTKNFWRLRIGIQPTLKKHTKADKIILKKFTPGELKELDKIMKKAIHQLADSFL